MCHQATHPFPAQFSGTYYEPPGGEELPPSGAMLALVTRKHRDRGFCLVLIPHLAAPYFLPGDDERLTTRVCAPSDRSNVRGLYTTWCLVARCDPPGDRLYTSGSVRSWRLTTRGDSPGDLCRFRLAALRLHQALILLLMACVCCFYVVMLYLDQEMLCHDRRYVASGSCMLDYGRVEKPWGLSSHFLFVFDDDRVILYTGADDATSDVVDA
ncbi:hypothetical protein DEO72_LG7g1653 [Vigna unguiculata]|uniref:Uncharacterized protein n=1 Tax=Vigna unguiculata TaxID=3917 RepID=A0A4D6MG07_VIGUN|nr:hypothetical protein DEO72_LG7g1653 [Vigna unguiculata]